MKIKSIIIILCLLSLFFCDEEGGVKVAVNDKFINSILLNFESDIKDLLQGVQLDDTDSVTNMVFGIPNFSTDKVDLSFGEDGLINIKLKNLEPYLTGTYHYKIIWEFSNNFKVILKDFSLDAQIRAKEKELSSGNYAPYAEFVGDPNMDFTIDIDIDGVIGTILAEIINFLDGFTKKIILPIMKEKSHELLEMILNQLPNEAQIGDYWIDFTLASPVKLGNKFLQVNSYALIFSKEYPKTQDKTRYSLSSLPSISDNQLQLYVSEYSLNSAAFTYLTVNSDDTFLKYTLSTGFINIMLPGITKIYGNKDAEISLIPKPQTNVQLTEEYMYVSSPGTFYVRVDGVENPVFACELDLTLKAQASVEKGPKLSAVINDMTGTIGEILVNEVTTASPDLIEKGFLTLKNAIVQIINAYIKQNVDIPFPSIMGIDFTDINIQHKDNYLLVNFNITR